MGACDVLEPEFKKLMNEYQSTSGVLIAHANCYGTSGERALCDSYKLKYHPTLFYGSVNNLQEYKGASTYSALSQFARQHLSPGPGPGPTPSPYPPAPPAPSPSGCYDKMDQNSCNGWARMGYCQRGGQYYGYMYQNCCKTCRFGAAGEEEEALV